MLALEKFAGLFGCAQRYFLLWVRGNCSFNILWNVTSWNICFSLKLQEVAILSEDVQLVEYLFELSLDGRALQIEIFLGDVCLSLLRHHRGAGGLHFSLEVCCFLAVFLQVICERLQLLQLIFFVTQLFLQSYDLVFQSLLAVSELFSEIVNLIVFLLDPSP